MRALLYPVRLTGMLLAWLAVGICILISAPVQAAYSEPGKRWSTVRCLALLWWNPFAYLKKMKADHAAAMERIELAKLDASALKEMLEREDIK